MKGYQTASIIYFLGRNGTTDPPHLITARHLHDDGVHLRDVKRWIAELREDDAPDSFAWSYKRRCKGGYMWHDLKDDDLIAPISHNEYVLRGFLLPICSLDEVSLDEIDKKAEMLEERVEDHQVVLEPKLKPESLHVNVSPKSPPQLDRDSWIKSYERSESTSRRMVVFKTDATVRKQKDEQRRKGSRPSKASHIFCNMLHCGSTDANDSAVRPASAVGSGGPCRSRPTDNVPRRQRQKSSDAENFRKEQASGEGKNTKRTRSAMHKTAGAPDCSQCGRPFDPKKLHSHMQSCKAMRLRGK